MRTVLLCSALLLSALPTTAGGGWTRPRHHGYLKLGLTTVGTSSYHTLTGTTISTARFRQQVLGLYGEYGITNRLETVLQLPLYRRASFPGFTPSQGFGDAEIGFRYGLLTGKWPLAVGLAAELPTGNPRARGLERQQAGSFINLPTGDGELNLWTRAALSHSFSPRPAYVTLDVGYNLRTQGFTPQYTLGAEAGYQVLGKLWGTLAVRTLTNIRPPRPDRLASIGIGEGVAYSALTLGTSYAVQEHLSATLSASGGFGRLRNVYSGVQITAGIAAEW